MKRMKIRGWVVKLIGTAVYSGGIVFSYVAISMQNVALVNALGSIQPFFVFLFALILSILAPTLMKESLDKRTLFMKIMSCILIVFGSWLVVI